MISAQRKLYKILKHLYITHINSKRCARMAYPIVKQRSQVNNFVMTYLPGLHRNFIINLLMHLWVLGRNKLTTMQMTDHGVYL